MVLFKKCLHQHSKDKCLESKVGYHKGELYGGKWMEWTELESQEKLLAYKEEYLQCSDHCDPSDKSTGPLFYWDSTARRHREPAYANKAGWGPVTQTWMGPHKERGWRPEEATEQTVWDHKEEKIVAKRNILTHRWKMVEELRSDFYLLPLDPARQRQQHATALAKREKRKIETLAALADLKIDLSCIQAWVISISMSAALPPTNKMTTEARKKVEEAKQAANAKKESIKILLPRPYLRKETMQIKKRIVTRSDEDRRKEKLWDNETWEIVGKEKKRKLLRDQSNALSNDWESQYRSQVETISKSRSQLRAQLGTTQALMMKLKKSQLTNAAEAELANAQAELANAQTELAKAEAQDYGDSMAAVKRKKKTTDRMQKLVKTHTYNVQELKDNLTQDTAEIQKAENASKVEELNSKIEELDSKLKTTHPYNIWEPAQHDTPHPGFLDRSPRYWVCGELALHDAFPLD